jgi:hypothetical protein
VQPCRFARTAEDPKGPQLSIQAFDRHASNDDHSAEDPQGFRPQWSQLAHLHHQALNPR